MAAFVAGDVTYTVSKAKKLEDNRLVVKATLAFGDGSKTYATGGVPMTLGGLGFATFADDIVFDDNGGSAYIPIYNGATNKLKLFFVDVLTGLLSELTNGTAIAAQTLKCMAIGR